jgi:hypothetical protein
MDEKNLKRLFIKYINTGHNDWNNFLSLNPQNPDIEIRTGVDLVIKMNIFIGTYWRVDFPT